MLGKPPIAVPKCGFNDEKCISYSVEIITGVMGGFGYISAYSVEIITGVMGGIVVVMSVITFVLYRNWKYEQELDSLLWKVDFRDIQMSDDSNANSIGTKISRPIHPLIRTSQVSLSSNPDADFRYSSIFTQIGIYKGRVFAIKKIHKKSIDITREMKKEFKMIRDIRHDNLNAFIGACTDPPNICIITEYCTRGSLKDILENEDVKLDNMFIASLVGDILADERLLPSHYTNIYSQAINTLDQNVDLTLRQFWKSYDIYQAIKIIGRAWGDVTETAMRSVWKTVCPQIVPQVQNFEDQSFEEVSGENLELSNPNPCGRRVLPMKKHTEIEEEEKAFITKEMSLGFQELNSFQKMDPDTDRFLKVQNMVECSVACYKQIYEDRKRAGVQTLLSLPSTCDLSIRSIPDFSRLYAINLLYVNL
ncbi:Protein tyrosine and serine/threonine kinase [Popillia japonica]|uniref:guanylate cyclase n=1 Tax=Popillia japonica TaxID=7064 RepID=A0AAW1N5P8_POPJA